MPASSHRELEYIDAQVVVLAYAYYVGCLGNEMRTFASVAESSKAYQAEWSPKLATGLLTAALPGEFKQCKVDALLCSKRNKQRASIGGSRHVASHWRVRKLRHQH